MFNHLFDINKKIRIHKIRTPNNGLPDFSFDVARFDELHTEVSGNKYFKLKYNITEALNEKKQGVITMGGAFSNHLAATAFICHHVGIQSIGIIRGELPVPLNHTLSFCSDLGMQLIPVARSLFTRNNDALEQILNNYSNHYFIPMGGENEHGIKGSAEMTDMIPGFESYQAIICALGSGTMFKGIQKKISNHQLLIGIPSMKIKQQDQQEFYASMNPDKKENIQIYFEYAGNGFGKPDPKIIALMNDVYQQEQLPLDFVYTGKVFHAVLQLTFEGKLEISKKNLMIHSGGLQGNLSLPPSTLIF